MMGPTWFEHDPRGYLTSATRPDGSVQYRMADEVGNVYRSAAQDDRNYAKGGRLVEADGVMYVHNADGELIEKTLPDGRSWKYAWDFAGQLVEVMRPDGQKVSFAYDALGRRVKKTFAGKTTRYVWDRDEVVHEIVESAAPVTWVFEPGTFALLAKEENGKRHGVVIDHLGTPRMMADEAGALAWKAQLDLYGVPSNDVVLAACPWRWPGQYEDAETGLYYNRFRYYDPEAGRYVSQDPIGLAGGLHAFAYPWDPLGAIDPFGLECRKVNPRRLIPRQGPEEMTRSVIDGLAKAMRKVGFMEAVKKYRFPEAEAAIEVVEVGGKLIIDNGHHRAAAAVKAGLAEVPVVVREVGVQVAKAFEDDAIRALPWNG